MKHSNRTLFFSFPFKDIFAASHHAEPSGNRDSFPFPARARGLPGCGLAALEEGWGRGIAQTQAALGFGPAQVTKYGRVSWEGQHVPSLDNVYCTGLRLINL